MIYGIIFFLLSVLIGWDSYTTFIGTMSIIAPVTDPTTAHIIFGVMLACGILAFLLATHSIWSNSGTALIVARLFWAIALGYDLWTSFNGNKDYVFNGNIATTSQLVLLIGATILTSGAPMFFTLMRVIRKD